MSYCRFRNTLNDLRDCVDHLGDPEEEMSDEERSAKKSLVALCSEIADEN